MVTLTRENVQTIGRISPAEVLLLMAAREKDGLNLEQLSTVSDIVGPCLHYVCNSLCRRGYLERNSLNEYQVTWEGKSAIIKGLLEI